MKTLSKTKEQLLIECESQKKALYIHLLYDGKLSIKNAYSLFGISNISREVRRQIEKTTRHRAETCQKSR